MPNWTLSGNTLSIRRRSDFKHDSSDHVRVLAGSQTLLQKEGKWTEYFFEDGHGYDLTLDLSTLPAEQATVKITSWNDKQTYNLLTVDILKAADGWHFDDTTALAQQYNYDLLRRLQNGQVPNDFAALKSQYGQTSDGAAVLAQIEAKALEVTAGCTDDRSKAEAINAGSSTTSPTIRTWWTTTTTSGSKPIRRTRSGWTTRCTPSPRVCALLRLCQADHPDDGLRGGRLCLCHRPHPHRGG